MRSGKPMFFNAVLLTGVNLLLRLLSTSFQVWLSGRIGAAGIGLLQLVLSAGALALTAAIAGIRTAAMYLSAAALGRKQPEQITSILNACRLYSLVCSCIAAFCLYRSAPWLADHWIGEPKIIPALRLIALFLPLTCQGSVLAGYYTAAGRIRTLAGIEIAEQLGSIAVTVLTLRFYAGTDTARACLCVAAGSCFGSALSVFALSVLQKKPGYIRQASGPVWRPLLEAALPLALADNLKSGISTAETMMVPRRLALYPGTGSPLATFGLICGMVFPVMMFPAAILYALAELLIPELARCHAAGSSRRIHYLIRRSLRITCLYGFLCAGLLFLTADRLCLALYHRDDAGRCLRLFVLLVPMLYCDIITDAMTKGLGQQRSCVRYNILTSALDVLFLYLLLPGYGISGYFFSFLVTHVLNFILSLRRLLKLSGMALPLRLPVLAASAAGAALELSSLPVHPAGRIFAFCCLYGSLLVLFQILTLEDLQWLRGLLHSSDK